MTPSDFKEALCKAHDTFNEASLVAAREKMAVIDILIAKAKEAGLTDAQVGSIVYSERFKGSMRLVAAEDTISKEFTSERSLMP